MSPKIKTLEWPCSADHHLNSVRQPTCFLHFWKRRLPVPAPWRQRDAHRRLTLRAITLDRVIFALLHLPAVTLFPERLHEGAHAWNSRQATRGTTAHAFSHAQSSLGLVATVWSATRLPPRVSSQAGGNLSSVLSTAGLPVSYKLGVHWHFCWQGPILNSTPVLDSSAQTTRDNQLDFFCKT